MELTEEEIEELLAHYLGEELEVPSSVPMPDQWEELRPVVVTTAAEAREAARALRGQGQVAVDCEAAGGMHRFGRLSVVQVADWRGQCWLFDVTAGGDAVLGPIKGLLEDSRVVKVMHDCRSDSDLLFHGHGVRVRHVADTQVAYAVLLTSDGQLPPLPVSLRTLHARFGVSAFGRVKELARDEMGDDADYWDRRPFTPLMLQYAAQDVRWMVYIYRQILSLLSEAGARLLAEYSALYANQYRSLSSAHRRAAVDAEETRDPSIRFVPSYGIPSWDAIARPLDGLSTAKRFRPANDTPQQLRRKTHREAFFS
ncbi:MAG: hypothetical protein Q8P67_12405 [archaeon]|nr:hypothetical protein [archaeon]